MAHNPQAKRSDHVDFARTANDSPKMRDLTTVLILSVKTLIASRRLKPGDKLLTERQLAAEFVVNRVHLCVRRLKPLWPWGSVPAGG